MPNYRWMYHNAQIALTLRSDYQRMQRDARLHSRICWQPATIPGSSAELNSIQSCAGKNPRTSDAGLDCSACTNALATCSGSAGPNASSVNRWWNLRRVL